MQETLLRALLQFLVFMSDYEGTEFTDQDALRQCETLTVMLESMPAADRVEFHEKFSALVQQLEGHEKAVAEDFLEGIEFLAEEDL